MKKIILSKQEVEHLYSYCNYTDKQIANQLGCSKAVITRFRNNNGIIRLHKDDKWLISKRKEGLNDTQIAELIGCNPGTISKAFKRITGVVTKKSSYSIKNNLFSSYTKEECYWAGFILADGHIETSTSYGRKVPNYKLRIKLSSKDMCHLFKFSKFLGDESIKIKHTEKEVFNKIHSSSELKISRKQICENLINNYEINSGVKSTKEFISNKIPKEMLSHFIRGYFDGDGSIYKKNNYNSCGLTIVGSKTICEQFLDYFKVGYIHHDSNSLYRYEVYTKKHIQFIKKKLYKDSNSSIRLDRKFDKFKDLNL